MSATVTLGVDLGSHGVRAVAVHNGAPVACASADYSVAPPTRRAGDDVWSVFGDCIAELPADVRRQVAVIGITGVRGAVIGIRSDGEPATPLFPDFDNDAVPVARSLERRYGDALLERTGCPPFPLSGLPKMMLHAADHSVRWWLSLQDYVAFRCTGEIVLSAGSGLRLGVLNAGGDAIDRALVEEVGLDAGKFPPVVPVGAVVGHLAAETALGLGLGRATPVVACPGDVPAGFVATGAASGSAFANLGTTTVVCCLAVGDGPKHRLTHEMLDGGRRSYETGAGAGGITFDWLARILGVRHGRLEIVAGEARPSAIRVAPELLSPWGDHPGGAITGICAGDGVPEIARAAYRDVAARIVSTLDELQAAAGPLSDLVLGGGGAESELLCSDIAALWKGSLRRLSGRELAAEGAAAVAAGARLDVGRINQAQV
jgi:sugar (pentulose or hexulose) kinase